MKRYKVHEFAELSGVTVRALHHYDRIGLLKAARSEAGYRIYAERDLERLEQIVALKFIGLGLGQIKAVLERSDVKLPDALRMQREVLEEKQRLVARAIGAITDAEEEIQTGKAVGPAVFKRLIEVIQMQDNFDFVKQYFSDETWGKFEDAFEDVAATLKTMPREEWKSLGCDIQAACGMDPAGEEAQALLGRSEKLVEKSPELTGFLTRLSTDPGFLAEARKASADNWPAGLPSRMKERCHEVGQFFLKANKARTGGD